MDLLLDPNEDASAFYETDIQQFAAISLAKNRQDNPGTSCLDCKKEIPKERREAIKGCRFCISCQKEQDNDPFRRQTYEMEYVVTDTESATPGAEEKNEF